MSPKRQGGGAESFAVPPQGVHHSLHIADTSRQQQGRLVVEVVEDAAGLARLENTWNSLWASDASADVFSSFNWFVNLWEHFGQGFGPSTLVANSGENLMPFCGSRWHLHICIARDETGAAIAVLPLVRVQASFMHFRGRVLATPTNHHAPRSGLVASRFDAEVAAALCAAICADSRWDFLLLDGLRHGIGRFECLELALREQFGLMTISRGHWDHAYLTCRGGWSAVLADKSSNFRRKLAKCHRSLAELGELTLQRFIGADAASVGLDTFVAVDRSSWKARDGEVIDQEPELKKYYQALLRRFALNAGAEVWVLRISGVLAAACICLNDGRSRYTLKASFSLGFGQSTRISPSHWLIGRIVEGSCSAPPLGVDFVSRIDMADRWADKSLEFGHAFFCRSRLISFASRLRYVVRHRIARHRSLRVPFP